MSKATENVILSKSGLAAADYSAKQYNAAYFSGAEAVTVNAAAGGWSTGPLQTAPESGDMGSLGLVGLSRFKLGGTVSIGSALVTNAAGKWVAPNNNSDFVVARALQAGVADDIITGYMTHEGYNSAFPNLVADGIGSIGILRSTYSFAVHGGAIGTIDLPGELPDNAVVTRGRTFVSDAVTSAGSATVAFSIATDDVAGLLGATAIATMGSAGWHELIQDGTAAAVSEECTAARHPQAVIAVADVTAGIVTMFLEYVIVD